MSKRYKAGVIGRTGAGDYGHGLETVYRDLEQVDLVALADPRSRGPRRSRRAHGCPAALRRLPPDARRRGLGHSQRLSADARTATPTWSSPVPRPGCAACLSRSR